MPISRLPEAGTIAGIACGSTIRRKIRHRPSPSACGGLGLAVLDRQDAAADDLGGERGDVEGEADERGEDAGEQVRRLDA